MIATPAPPLVRTPGTAIAAIWLSALLAMAILAIRLFGGEPFFAVRAAGAIGLGLLAAAPVVLGWLAVRGRAALVAAAAAVDLVLMYAGAASLVGLVFLPVVVLFGMSFGKLRGRTSSSRTLAVVVVAFSLATLALLALFRHDDPVCWATTRSGETVRLDPGPFVHGNAISMGSADEPPGIRESGCSSDFISASEAATSGALVVVMVFASWIIATPRAPATSPAPLAA
jgi:hypothetical protein